MSKNTLILGLEIVGAKKSAAQLEKMFQLMQRTQRKFTNASPMKKWGMAFKGAMSAAAAAATIFVTSTTILMKLIADGVKAFAKFDAAASKLKATLDSFNTKGQGINYSEYLAIADRMAESTALTRTELAEGASLIALLGTNAQVFEGAMNAAADYATATGTQLKHAARWMQTVLEAPTKGIDKLRRAGIHVTKQLQQQLALMEQRGQMDQARLVVLAQFEKYEQAAEAYAQSTAGLWDRAKRAIQLMKSEFGEGIMGEAQKEFRELVEIVEELREELDFKDAGRETVKNLAQMAQDLIQIGHAVRNVWDLARSLDMIGGQLRFITDLWFDWRKAFENSYNRVINGLKALQRIWIGFGEDIAVDSPTFKEWGDNVADAVGDGIKKGIQKASPEFKKLAEAGIFGAEAEGVAGRLAELNQTADAYSRKVTDLAREEEYLTYLRKTQTAATQELITAQEKIVQDLGNYVDNIDLVRDHHSRLSLELRKQSQAMEIANMEAYTKKVENFGKTVEKLATPAEKAAEELNSFLEILQDKMDEASKNWTKGMNIPLQEGITGEGKKLQEAFERYQESIRRSIGVYSEAQMAQIRYNDAVEQAKNYLKEGVINEREATTAINAANKAKEDELGITARRQKQIEEWANRRQGIYDDANATKPFADMRKSIVEVLSFMQDTRTTAKDRAQGQVILNDIMTEINGQQKEMLTVQKQQLEFSRMSDPLSVFNAIQDSLTKQDDPTTKAVKAQTAAELRALRELRDAILNRTIPAVAVP